MTIDERVEAFMSMRNAESGMFRRMLKQTLLEAARDQRHVCAEAVAGLENANLYNRPETVGKDAAHQAVMNASIA